MERWQPVFVGFGWLFFFKEIKDNNLNYLPLKQFALFSASYKIVELDRSVSLPVPGAMLLSVFTTWQGNV